MVKLHEQRSMLGKIPGSYKNKNKIFSQNGRHCAYVDPEVSYIWDYLGIQVRTDALCSLRVFERKMK
jgi:hypothetical protein